ncbi:MAG: NAD(P)-dependent oxidoreductase [Gammaproteobacteria bacterium]|nr:NAD(P)-dependent oxidoreductase [Gammaproteobacteria bacterium]
MKTVLIMGATGFVGSHILEAFMQRNDPTLLIVAACRDKRKLLPEFNGEIREGDLRDAVYRGTVVKDIDVLCNAVAWSSLWGNVENSRRLFLEPNLALIKVARSAGVKRFINTSTTSAASPRDSSDPQSKGIPRLLWPHLCNVIKIEDALRNIASADFQVTNLRLGIFAGHRYSLGVLPILAPRLKTHLVPWVSGGRTSLPIIDGRDIGQAFMRAVLTEGLDDYEGFNIVGPEIPTVREVINLLHEEFDLPKPHFSVPFAIAYPFAWLMEKLDPIMPWEPLVTRSIIHLMEEVGVDNAKAERLLGYRPTHPWREAVRTQMQEMSVRQTRSMSMALPVS